MAVVAAISSDLDGNPKLLHNAWGYRCLRGRRKEITRGFCFGMVADQLAVTVVNAIVRCHYLRGCPNLMETDRRMRQWSRSASIQTGIPLAIAFYNHTDVRLARAIQRPMSRRDAIDSRRRVGNRRKDLSGLLIQWLLGVASPPYNLNLVIVVTLK